MNLKTFKPEYYPHMRLVLSIDPGNKQSAYTLVGFELNKISIIEKGICDNDEIINLIEILGEVSIKMKDIHRNNNMFMAIENISSYGMAVGQEVFDTIFWIGRLYQLGKQYKMSVVLPLRRQIKIHMCNSMAAKDGNIRQVIIDRFGKTGSKKRGYNPVYNDKDIKMRDDMWQAFAVALYFIDNFNTLGLP